MVPIGDRFTMGPDVAALAVQRFFTLKAAIPCHYGSFPIIEPTADRFVAALGRQGHPGRGAAQDGRRHGSDVAGPRRTAAGRRAIRCGCATAVL